MIISYDNDSLIFDMHIMMKMISRYYHSIITQISIKYQNINSQTNNILAILHLSARPESSLSVKTVGKKILDA